MISARVGVMSIITSKAVITGVELEGWDVGLHDKAEVAPPQVSVRWRSQIPAPVTLGGRGDLVGASKIRYSHQSS